MISGILASSRLPPNLVQATDPYWSSVVALLHFDGADGATTTTDQKGHVMTMTGPIISTARSKFGVSSAYFDGSLDIITTPSSTDFDFGSGDFTIEFFFYVAVMPTVVHGLIARRNTTSNYAPFDIELNSSGKLVCLVSTSGSSWVSLPTATATITTGSWNHVALVRDGSTIRRFINGVADGTVAISGSLMASGIPLCIGAASASKEYSLNGNMDELRITKSARYTSSFTVPSAAFPNS